MRRLEADSRLDAPARRLESVAGAVVRSPAASGALRGAWFGHALHPLLTDFPLGAWMSASFLDLFGGPHARGASQRLVGFGLVATVGGYFGGHLTLVRKIGTTDTSFGADR